MQIKIHDTNSNVTVIEADDFSKIDFIDDDGSFISSKDYGSMKAVVKREIEEGRKHLKELMAYAGLKS
jgi:hypothetical protein